MRIRTIISVGLTIAALTGCGDAETVSAIPEATTGPPIGVPAQATPDSTETPSAAAVATAAATVAATPATVTPTATPPLVPVAEDDEVARTPARFTIDGEGITPARVEVPAFLAIRLEIRNDLSAPVAVRFDDTDHEIPASSSGRIDLPGRRPGTYTVAAGTSGTAQIVAR